MTSNPGTDRPDLISGRVAGGEEQEPPRGHDLNCMSMSQLNQVVVEDTKL